MGIGDQKVTPLKGCLAVLGFFACVFVVVGVMSRFEKPQATPPPAKTATQVAAETKGAADRSFKSNVETDAAIQVHEWLIKERRRSMPENWKERGELLKREGNFAIVLVHTGIKESVFSPMVVVQNYVMSVEVRGDQYFATAAMRYKDEPTGAQIAALMIQGKWPSAMAKMNGAK